MSRRHDEGFEIDFPFFRFYAGERGVRIGGDDEDVIDMEQTDYDEYRAVRKRVRARLRFLRHLFFYLALNGLFVLLDWRTGGSGSGINWSIWVIIIWGVFLAWELFQSFVAPYLWGREMEERLVRRELRRRRGA
jgi:hypothetical protein